MCMFTRHSAASATPARDLAEPAATSTQSRPPDRIRTRVLVIGSGIVAESGVDWISIGALTHSVPSLDLGLDFRVRAVEGREQG
jgi:hypothetical protein